MVAVVDVRQQMAALGVKSAISYYIFLTVLWMRIKCPDHDWKAQDYNLSQAAR